MKKLSKVLAAVSCAAMTFASLGSVNSEAIWIMIDNVFEAPEGYTEFDDKGSCHGVNGASRDNDDYTAYIKSDEYGYASILVYYSYRYNYTVFTVAHEKIDVYDSIYEKYSDKLNMQHYDRDIYSKQLKYDEEFCMYDMYDADGYVTKDPSKMEDKHDIIMEMAAEMYDAGCITEATYKSVTAGLAIGSYAPALVVFKTENPTEEEKKLHMIKFRKLSADLKMLNFLLMIMVNIELKWAVNVL